MDNEDLNSWYLIQCKPNKNKLAINNLNRQGFETFYLMKETWIFLDGRLKI